MVRGHLVGASAAGSLPRAQLQRARLIARARPIASRCWWWCAATPPRSRRRDSHACSPLSSSL
ncbi:hypothetical protein GQ55_4G362000 [Panicum hallii var. hallii]|uniref:Uncharacterized protein n=1 Tax=Panicum hallii var. hallii TaxID=1504633 RepID=A0A2T7E3S5_9POAL|nr:hypothetical protein GQ55_4G362000 [Panicum hallii var. hallii]